MSVTVAYPKGRRKRVTTWTRHTHRALIIKWLVQWTTHNAILHAAMPTLMDIMDPKHLLTLPYELLTEQYLREQRTHIKRTLHGTHRTQMRKNANARHTQVLNAHHSKALGEVIRLLTAQPSSHCDLNTLHCPTEGQITDHYRIHAKVTAFFTNWY